MSLRGLLKTGVPLGNPSHPPYPAVTLILLLEPMQASPGPFLGPERLVYLDPDPVPPRCTGNNPDHRCRRTLSLIVGGVS